METRAVLRGVRLSAHYYVSPSDIDRVLAAAGTDDEDVDFPVPVPAHPCVSPQDGM